MPTCRVDIPCCGEGSSQVTGAWNSSKGCPWRVLHRKAGLHSLSISSLGSCTSVCFGRGQSSSTMISWACRGIFTLAAVGGFGAELPCPFPLFWVHLQLLGGPGRKRAADPGGFGGIQWGW